MVERSLSMREALGSMPRFSTYFSVATCTARYHEMRTFLKFVSMCSYSSVGQSVRLITVRSAVQARVGAYFVGCAQSTYLTAKCQRGHCKPFLVAGSQFARVVKGVDLRSTARKCAWVRTPQLTCSLFNVNPRKSLGSSPDQRRTPWGSWCSGITSASHAEGPGFKSQWVHSWRW